MICLYFIKNRYNILDFIFSKIKIQLFCSFTVILILFLFKLISPLSSKHFVVLIGALLIFQWKFFSHRKIFHIVHI